MLSVLQKRIKEEWEEHVRREKDEEEARQKEDAAKKARQVTCAVAVLSARRLFDSYIL